MAGLFAKAAAKQTKPTTPKRKQTVWLTSDARDNGALGRAVHELVNSEAQKKALEAKCKIFKGVIGKFAEHNLVGNYADTGVPPETPLVVQNDDGEKVTYVVQDRSGQYAVKDDQREALEGLLGKERTEDLLYTETNFGFSRLIMSLPGVMEVVEEALEKAIKRLTDDRNGKPILTEEQAGELLDVTQKVSLRPGIVERLAIVCGRDPVRIKQFLDIVGSHITRYVKP